MHLLSTALTTELETIDILTIFSRSSDISRSTHCSALTCYKPIKEKVYIYFKLLTWYVVRILSTLVGLSVRFSEV